MSRLTNPGLYKHELMEQLAIYEHQSWSNWILYMFELCVPEVRFEEGDHFETGNLIIPKQLVKRWTEQAQKNYMELSDKEKESDRDEVAQILPLIDLYVEGKINV